MESDAEEYLLLLLADSNLPTGSFVASSGLESYMKHGFGSLSTSKAEATLNFVRCSIESFARSTVPFVTDAHDAVSNGKDIEFILAKLRELDGLYHRMTLNNVTRRASQSQGVALLTLYSRGFAKHESLQSDGADGNKLHLYEELVDEFKLSIRRGDSPGHLPICWGILTAALGLSLSTSQFYPQRFVYIGIDQLCRAGTVSSSIPPCSLSSLSIGPSHHHRTLRRPENPTP
jgi:urease accessory protein